MKKSLVVTLALVFVLGIAGTAFAAANPFVDVPAKHWAYDAVSKLAQAGIVDGYNDGTFRGDKTMTRYEMAQIVAKAMTRSDKANAETKALVDKLAVEFNAELQNLGVRVAKLEANQSNIKFSGDARVRWVADHNERGYNYLGVPSVSTAIAPKNNNTFSERFRLNMNANINDNTSMYARIVTMNNVEMGASETFRMTDAAFTTKDTFNTGVTSTVGRFSQKFLYTGYFADTMGLVDGAKLTAGKDLKVTFGMANWTQATNGTVVSGVLSSFNGYAAATLLAVDPIEDAIFVTADYKTSPATAVSAMWLKETTGGIESNYDVKGLGFATKFAKNLVFTGEYYKNTSENAIKVNDNDPTAWVAKLAYKGADAKKAGSWGAAIEYRRFDLGVNPINSSLSFETGAAIPVQAVKGYGLTFNKALAKNVMFDAYQTFGSKSAVNGVASVDVPNYSRAQIAFMF